MYSSLESYGNYSTIECTLDWEGSKPQKFKRGKRIYQSKDAINQGIRMPKETIESGRSHYINEYSPQYQFRRPKKYVQYSNHWFPRTNQIKTFDFKPTMSPIRRQRRHIIESHNPQSRVQSIKTIFLKDQTNEYIVEDRMQRKGRVDQLSLRKTFYKNLDIFKKPSF